MKFFEINIFYGKDICAIMENFSLMDLIGKHAAHLYVQSSVSESIKQMIVYDHMECDWFLLNNNK